MADGSRINRDIKGFVPYMNDTDDYQKATDPATGGFRYLNWGWSAAQSTQWTAYRTLADSLFGKYNNKNIRNTDTTNKLHKLIDDVVLYDQQNKLLDKIAAANMPPAILTDFEMFNVKRGTVLASPGSLRTVDPGMKAPLLTLKKTAHLLHQLHVANPDNPKSVAKPKGIKEIMFYRATAAQGAAAPADGAYTYIGDVKRGKYVANYTTTDVGTVAYYKVRYKTKSGVFGAFSLVLIVVIM